MPDHRQPTADFAGRPDQLSPGTAVMQALFEATLDPLLVVDRQGRIERLNVAAEKQFGYSRDEMIGQPLNILLPERFRSQHQDHMAHFMDQPFQRAMGNGLEFFHRRKDGSEFVAEVALSPIGTGPDLLTLVAVRDITERKRAEETLRDSEARYKRLLSSITDYIYTVRVERGRAVATDHGPSCVVVTGYSPQEYAANPELWYQMVHPEDRPLVLAQAAKVVAGQSAAPVEVRFNHKDGTLRWLRNSVVARKDGSGTVVAYDGLITDITERKLAEEGRRVTEQRLQSILDNTPAVMSVKAASDGRFLLANRQFEVLFHVTQQQLLGKTDADVFAKAAAEVFRANDQKVLAARRPIEFEEVVPQADGLHTYFSVKFPLFNEAGEPYAICGISTDITERRRLEQELLAISDRERNRIGQDLHDGLCQQLISTALLSNLLEQKLRTANRPEAANAHEVGELIDQAITQARNTVRGLFPVKLEAEGLTSALQELAANVSRLSSIPCALHCPQPVPVADHAVATHLYRIAQEATNNAVKHGHASRIDIHLSEHDGEVRLAVEDDGRGLRADSERTTGMGLRIMKYRADLIGGTLKLDSATGGGTQVVCLSPRPKEVESTR